MNSKLFHTIVGVGISLGALSTACGDAAPETTNGTEVASSAQEAQRNATASGTEGDAGAIVDAFCDVPWPTTKGVIHRPYRPGQSIPECVDPHHECGASGPAGVPFACESENGDYASWSVCVDGAWRCNHAADGAAPGPR